MRRVLHKNYIMNFIQLIYFKKLCKGQAGSALIGLIVTMVFLGALAAVMIAQTTTGSLGFVNENYSLRAYYLAESGFRYAAAKLKNGGESALDTLLNHDGDGDGNSDGSFSLGNKGSFTLEFTTYIFEVTGGIGTNELVTRVSFGKAPLLTGTGSGYVKVGNNPVQPFDAVTVDASPNDDVVRFTNNTQIWNVFDGEDVKLVVKRDGSPVSEGGDLNLQAGSSDAFPQYNGRFKADDKIYQYKEREPDKLREITRVDDSTWEAPSLLGGDDIVLQAFAELTSTGTYGEGNMAVSRKIVYNIPLSTSEKSEFHDTFETKDNWEEVFTLGTHDIETIGDDSVLKVTGTDSVGGGDEGSLIKLDSPKVDKILERSHSSAGNFLSYDAQVKVGFDPGVPSTYMAGVSFRQDAVAEGNSYGVSFLKAGSSDKIPADLVPYNDCPMIVLWQQTDSGNDKKWLAYKHLIGRPIYLFDDMEIDKSNWTEDPPWDHIITDFHSTTTCWTDSPAGDYAENVDTSLETIAIDFSGASSPKLSFWHHYSIFPWRNVMGLYYGGRADIEVSTDGGIAWPTRLERYAGDQDSWKNEIIDLSAYAGQSDVRIRFRLRSVNPWVGFLYVGSDGWYIDDVTVAEDFPINEATLMVRVKEVATVSFTGGGTTPVEAGDIVTQTNGARGTVIETPILESGDWGSGDAAGIILLNKLFRNDDGTITTPFADGLALNDVNNVQRAASSNSFRARDNYIRVYYGDISGYGTPDGQWLDYDKHGNPRGELHWPPDELEDWSADNDYFTLVQWDEVEDVAVSSLDKISSLVEPDAILRTNELTTSTGIFTGTEIGLHTFGDDSTNVVYFDDFGLQADVSTSEGFFPAVQQ